jgi:polyphosphate kinase
MQRNFHRRIEVAFPIEDGNLRERVIGELLAIAFADNVKARTLQLDGTYLREPLRAGAKRHRSQREFIDLALHGRPARRGKAETNSKYPKVKLARRPESLSS